MIHRVRSMNRRRFLRESFAFSALASMNPLASMGAPIRPKPEASHLLMLGDWGRDTKDGGQRKVAEGMAHYAQQMQMPVEALLMLGDNWYDMLPAGVDSPRWQSGFEEMYPKSLFNCPAYAIPGNHDYQVMPVNKLEAELAYAKRGNTRWTMPSLWYSFTFPAKHPVITFIALDSNVPHAGTDGGMHEDGVDFTLTRHQHEQQLAWLETELGRTRTTPFTVVMAHHPIYSNGPHGDHPLLIADWEPLFRKHKVHAYLAGHDHDLQHLEFEEHPTSFVLSGGGGAELYTLRSEEAARGPYAAKVHGFTHLEATPKALTFRHLDGDGRVVHSFSKMPDGKMQIG